MSKEVIEKLKYVIQTANITWDKETGPENKTIVLSLGILVSLLVSPIFLLLVVLTLGIQRVLYYKGYFSDQESETPKPNEATNGNSKD